jgi:hypothetical protein
VVLEVLEVAASVVGTGGGTFSWTGPDETDGAAVDTTGFAAASLGGRTLKEVIINFSGLGALGL